MCVFQSTYVSRNDFPKSLPDFLLEQWPTLHPRDRRAIRKAVRSRHWIGAALQLGFLGMTGTTLRSLEYVPAAVLRHLGRQFRQPVPDIATLRTLYRRRPKRFAHQRWAIKQWSIYIPTEQRRHYARRYRAFGRPSPQVKSGSVERTCIFDETKRRYDPRALI